MTILWVLHYVNVFVLIKFSQKEQCFTLIIISQVINKFSIKSYVVDVYKNRRGEEILIPIRNISFYAEILKIITFYHFNTNLNFALFSLSIKATIKILKLTGSSDFTLKWL